MDSSKNPTQTVAHPPPATSSTDDRSSDTVVGVSNAAAPDSKDAPTPLNENLKRISPSQDDKNDILNPIAKKIKLFNGNFDDDSDDDDSDDDEAGGNAVKESDDKKIDQIIEHTVNSSTHSANADKVKDQFEKDLENIINNAKSGDQGKDNSVEHVRNEPTVTEDNTKSSASATATSTPTPTPTPSQQTSQLPNASTTSVVPTTTTTTVSAPAAATTTSATGVTPAATVYKDGLTIPADSELLKKNDALKTYNNFVQENSPNFHSQSSVQNQLLSIPLNLPAPQYLPPNIQLLINTIPSLDNLATQILRVIVQSPYQKILDLVANPETLAGMTYQTLISLFDNIKSMYSTEDPFLSVEHLTFGLWKEGSAAPTFFRGKEDTVQSTLRKVNLATFLNATLGTIDTGFFYLNESFLDVFCPDQALNPSQTITNLSSAVADIYDVATLSSHSVSTSAGKLLKSQTVLYLELKTQAYISALEAHERSREDIANDIFPDNLDEFLLKRKTRFNDNVKEKPSLTPSEVDFISRCKKRKENLLQADVNEDLSEQYDWLTFLKDFFEFSRKHIGYLIWGTKNSFDNGSISNHKNSNSHSSTSKNAPPTASSRAFTNNPLEGPSSNEEHFKFDPDTLPSEIVQHHREAKFSSSNVKHLSRRLWTKLEEQALKEALQVKGPQWAQILELYGAGGAVSEALKNRTQVQLKDKARNWKIFFLKNELPLPDYLKNVTGDLDSNKSGPKRGRKSADNNKRNNKPPRIEQRHVDAAAAAAAANTTNNAVVTTAATPAANSAPVVESKSSADPVKQESSTSNEISDEANIFAQQAARPPTATTETAGEVSDDEHLKNNDNDKQTKSLDKPEATDSDKISSDSNDHHHHHPQALGEHDKETESPATNEHHDENHNHREEEEPDYDNILKDLIDQATTNSEEHDKNSIDERNHANGVDAEVERSYKSTIEYFLKENAHLSEDELSELQPPPITISVVENDSDVIFRFSDQGGGVSKEELDKIWCFRKNPKLARQSLLNIHRLPGLDISAKVVKSPLFNKLSHTTTTAKPIDPLYDSANLNYGEGEHLFLTPTPLESNGSTSTLSKLITRPFQTKLV